MSINKLMSAEKALELTNTAGERILRINKQIEDIENKINMASLDGNRMVKLKGAPLSEVINLLNEMGYTYQDCYGSITIHW